MSIDKLKTSMPILKSFNDDKKIRIVGGIYRLKSGRVDLLT
jgi:carbonic anhydrase